MPSSAPSSPTRQRTDRDATPTAADGAPLFYPSSIASSSPKGAAALRDGSATPRASAVNGLRRMEVSSPLRYESSSPPRSAAGGGLRRGGVMSSGLGSGGLRSTAETIRDDIRSSAATPRAARRGDIHSSGLDSTPMRRRLMDVQTPSRQSAILSQGAPTSDADSGPHRVIWGTNVNIQDASDAVKNFLKNYQPKYRLVADKVLVNPGEGEDKVYVEMLRQMRALGINVLNLDVGNLRAYPPTKKAYHQLQMYPAEMIPIIDGAIKDAMIDILQGDGVGEAVLDEVEATPYMVRPFGFDETHNMRDLNPADIDRLVTIKGLVIRATPVIPDMKRAFFRCAVCQHAVTVEIDRGRIAEPTRCPREQCMTTNSMQIVHNRSEFADKQVIKLQETPDAVPAGQTPHAVSLCVYDELVDFCRAGDRVQITGIFRSVPVRINPRQRTIKSLFKTYLDVVHVQKIDKRRLGADVTTLDQELAIETSASLQETRKLSEEEVAEIESISRREDVYDVLARSLAPSIYEMEDVKKGILLQLFGGTNKTFTKGGGPRYRGDINVLLCGDPSTSKSQILQYVHKIAPRGVYTSGKGSSAVGLTAYVTRDQDTKQLVLESGALVLSDGGVCCIDEFDKMSDSTRSVLHEVMEQQTVSIAKAGIITTLNARTSILASANPIGSKYNPDLPVPANIDLPPTLLSRFDLVYLVLDKIDEAADRRLARHLVSMYLEDRPENAAVGDILSVDKLASYISYARENVQPVISEAAGHELVKAYVELRKLGEDVRAAERRITATTRQLESMIRLSEAHAKMRLAHEVTEDDVREANRLIRSAIKDYATDPITGRIDMDLITTGQSAANRRARGDMKNEVLNIVKDMTGAGQAARYSEVLKKLGEQSSAHVDAGEFGELMRTLEAEGVVKVTGEGARKVIRQISGAPAGI
ncbi:DNA replication licensing factor mcm4 [Saitoella complicata NRRL Y-17804]|uniref:DNA replication licensing factor MCM4 n=1 Tax=Saitoella complicata (strain BCRC 22490 / CBS 7301 / JCM 7358 / NBRC 10748 / NRRL Y-17804) TaxID=698492 RepID=A0A0E9NR96_SAICN|nr:DNA replication licensing factor mcm4 [Saitoella complicata NRRL Y-17804]ODQ52628.1 DNA replication licensing factor mcm4 [Saitoella complicata NRRL Y-17804]GAO52333.1 hypothetical protein G7K_6412-t1 [Saitoella complicata NRRL Y-17804]